MLTFAIVIPNKNQTKYIRTALDSLRSQSVKFNLAVMDGGSKDNIWVISKKYNDIISYFCSKLDPGQSYAIKEGTDLISGDIVSWLNADDYYFPEILSDVEAIFENDRSVDVVYGDAIHVDPDGFFLSYFPPAREYCSKVLARDNFICQPTCFYRRSIYEKVGGIDQRLEYTMDWDLWCRFSKANAKFYYLRKPMAAVRFYEGTKTLSGNKKRYEEIKRIEKIYGGRTISKSIYGAMYQDIISRNSQNTKDKVFLFLYEFARKTKHNYLRKFSKQPLRSSSLYGFRRWSSDAKGNARIHIPLYDIASYNTLSLKLEPFCSQYRVIINDKESNIKSYHNNYINVELPSEIDIVLKIEISRDNNRPWKLLEFKCKYE